MKKGTPIIRHSPFPNPATTEKDPAIERTEEFDRAFALMDAAEQHIFITGRAGTGKSTLLRHFMANTQRRIAVLAPTGLSAVNVGGQTIHSFFKFPPRLLQPPDIRLLPAQKRLFQELDTLIIDEISMVRADVLDAMDYSLRLNRGRLETPFGGVQIIAFGDLFQLSPVVEEDLQHYFNDVFETPYFFSASVLQQCDWQLLELKHNFRQSKDPFFFELLSRLGRNEMNSEDLEFLNERVSKRDFSTAETVTLTSTNAAAERINDLQLRNLDGEIVEYAANVKGDFEEGSTPAVASLRLKKGAQIMMLRNDAAGRWVNGDVGTVEACSPSFLSVSLGGERYAVEPVKWERIQYSFNPEENRMDRKVQGTFQQYPVRLSWAMTIHKSQGQTLEKVHVDLGSGAFAHGQVYVALSRCRSLEGLSLQRQIRPDDILFDDRVLSFLRRGSLH